MLVKRYACKTCGKTYQKLGWLKRHIAKFQHSPVWINLVDKRTIESRLCELEKQVSEILNKKFLVTAATAAAKAFTAGMDPIDRIQSDTYRPERNANKVNFAKVVSELKDVFEKFNGDVDRILKPIDPRTEPEIFENLELILA